MGAGLVLQVGHAVNLVTAAVLLALALPLFLAARRRPAAGILAAFLCLVGTNFLLPGIRCWLVPCSGHDLGARLGRLTLALDPPLLLGFVLAYLRARFDRRAALVLVPSCIASAGAAALALVEPDESFMLATTAATVDLLQVLLVANLVVAYAAAWAVALAAHHHASTPSLRRRARWLAVAVGIAVLPRMALLPWDLGLKAFVERGPFAAWIRYAGLPKSSFSAFVALVVGAGTLVAAYAVARRAFPPTGRGWDPLRVAGATAAGLYGVTLAAALLPLAFPQSSRVLYSGGSPGYGLRWAAFAAILAHGMLGGLLLEFKRLSTRYATVAGGLVGGIAAGLAVAVVASSYRLPDVDALEFSLAVGLAAVVPAGAGARGVLRWLDRTSPEDAGLARRLTLYRAALEAAWADGPPDARRRRGLERDRRAWGVSEEEARTLEHIVAGEADAEPADPRPGEEIAPGFVVECEIGQGAQARVLLVRAVDARTRLVAKVLQRRTTPRDDERFLREVRALQALDHPRVARLVEVGLWRGRRVLFFEDFGARSLRDALDQGDLDARARERVARDLLAGLAAAHEAGVVHGDVKPDNVLVDPAGRAALADFGLAMLAEQADVGATVTSLDAHARLTGTLAYMAPEQAQGRPATPRSDVYAAALVVAECLTGRPARRLQGRSAPESIEVVSRGSVDLRAVPPEWRDVLARALAVEPAARYADAGALLRALDAKAPAAG